MVIITDKLVLGQYGLNKWKIVSRPRTCFDSFSEIFRVNMCRLLVFLAKNCNEFGIIDMVLLFLAFILNLYNMFYNVILI